MFSVEQISPILMLIFLAICIFGSSLDIFGLPPLSSSCLCCRQVCLGTFLNQAALKLSKSAEDVENHLAGCLLRTDALDMLSP